MNRRNALKLMSLAGLSVAAPLPLRLLAQSAPASPYTGPLFVVIQANGGWDPTSFCDPKTNVAGEPIINTWAQSGSVQQAGNLSYAPFAANQAFFDKYYSYLMVVNGIDAQTNSHDAGQLHNWSGRLSEGLPSFPALAAAAHAPELPMAYVSNGGYAETADLIRFTRVDRVEPLRNLLIPNQSLFNEDLSYLDEPDLALVRAAQDARLGQLAAETGQAPRNAANRKLYLESLASSDGFDEFVALLPSEEELEPEVDENGNFAPLKQQAQLALLAFKAGITMTCDLSFNAFDTHDDHDNLHSTALSHLTDSIDYLWETAEELELADRLTVYVASDFGRTPRYNSDNGKDHWPIGSAMFMQKNAPWGNRVVGETDEGHNAHKINPATLNRDDSNGVVIRPGHLMKALRELAGIASDPIVQAFPVDVPESFEFF